MWKYVKVISGGVGVMIGIIISNKVIPQASPEWIEEWGLTYALCCAVFLITLFICIVIKYQKAIRNFFVG